ncbi:MAG: biopolymer transporter ExbD, partial [Leptolyngbya sp. SIO1D8]|nr:biopolymer transporter ExbD [Leptolyngbya sp. SIO1D8]
NAATGKPLPPQGIGSDGLQRQRLYVSVDAIGQVYLDQQPVTLDLLYDVLLQHQQNSPEGLIVLNAARDARYEDVIQVLDLLRSVGGDRVALATLPGESLDSQGIQQDDSLFDLSPFPSIEGDPSLGIPNDSSEFDLFAPESLEDFEGGSQGEVEQPANP